MKTYRMRSTVPLLLERLLTDEGQKAVAKAGYVPVNARPRQMPRPSPSCPVRKPGRKNRRI